MIRRAAITYDGLPVSSGGAHRLRTRGFLAGYIALQSFAETISLDTRPSDLFIEILEGDGIPRELPTSLLSELHASSPKKRVRKIGAYTAHQWDIETASLMQILETLERISPIPHAGYAGSSVVIHATWNLLLFDSRTRRELPYQNLEDYLGFDTESQCYLGRSSLYGRISETTSAHLFLSFPFEDVTVDAKRVAREIQDSFPARLSPKHWKLWTLTKRQNSYVGRKIAALC